MLNNLRFILCLVFFIAAFLQPATGQTKKATPKNTSVKKPKLKADSAYAPGPLFYSDTLFEFKLSGNLKEIFNDRAADNVEDHPMLLQYAGRDDKKEAIPVSVKSRGHFRRMKENCVLPPLWVDIEKEAKIKGTVFERQNKLKLVTPCRGDEYIVREYLVYKLYSLLSPQCMKARLAKVSFEDSVGKVKPSTQYCILIEDENKAAWRNGFILYDKKMVRNEYANPEEFTRVAVFEYLIGNTDWSVPYLHNIKLAFAKDTNDVPVPIPYDYDHSGIVSAPYAYPPEQLGITSVRDRIYRGYCQSMSEFQKTFELFNKLKDDIYKVYTTCPYIDEKYLKSTIKYLDDFYKVINTPKLAEREFRRPCYVKESFSVSGYQN